MTENNFINNVSFQESITHELDVIRNRVRNLIGSAHWGKEGEYKEVILKNILRKFLPNNLSIGTGFIVKNVSTLPNDNIVSSQIDLIIYDNTKPLLFKEGDFIITTASNVKGVIEVKTNIKVSEIKEIIGNIDNSILKIVPRSKILSSKLFVGLFAYDFDGNVENNNIKEAILASERIVNHISLGKNIFIKRWKKNQARFLTNQNQVNNDFYNRYSLINLSFSYFIWNVIDEICSIPKDQYWISFPIEGTKEIHKFDTIECVPKERRN